MEDFRDDGIKIRSFKDGEWYWIDKAVIKHYAAKIGATGFTVYSFLAAFVDSDQKCFPSQKYIADHIGYSRATVNKAINILEKQGLIRKVKKDRYHCVYQLLRCKAKEIQMSNKRNSGVPQIDTNDNQLTRINNDIDNRRYKFL
jgi:biotin operon repressor